jgi:mRNA-degrading endonuclease RelE of RelBE toxin-antitoxin system
MNYNILRTDTFSKHFKKLAKKYPSVASDYQDLLTKLQENPQLGKPLGRDCYKIRLTIKSKQSGKSGGVRVITYVRIIQKRITLLDIYDKSDKETITDKELDALIKTSL